MLRLCLSDGDTTFPVKAEAEVLQALGLHELAPCTCTSIKRDDLTYTDKRTCADLHACTVVS